MQPEGSLPLSLQPAFCPYPEPDLSSPRPRIRFISCQFCCYRSRKSCVFKAVSVLHISSQKFCVHFCFLWCTPHAPTVSVFFILSLQWCLAKRKVTPHYAVFPNLLLLPLRGKCSPHHLFPNNLFPYLLCYKSEGRWFDPSWCHWNF